MDMKFYRCETCGQIVAIVDKKACPVMCCGKPMKEIVPGTTDAAVEKHVPVVTVEGSCVKVTVGSVAHPMKQVFVLNNNGKAAVSEFSREYTTRESVYPAINTGLSSVFTSKSMV